MLELLGAKRVNGLKILEPGCSNGVVGCLFSLMGADVTLIDYSDKELLKAQKYAHELGVRSRIKFIQADLFSMPLPLRTYDLIWNDGVIEHFEDPVAVIKIMAQMARPGGKVLVTAPNKWTLNTLFIRAWRRWRNAYPFDRWGRERSFSEAQLGRMLYLAGLSNVRTSTHHLRRAFFDDYVVYPLLQGCGALKPWTPFVVNAVDTLEASVPPLAKLGFVAAAVGEV